MIFKWTNQIKVALSSGGVEYRSIHLSNYITQRTLCLSKKMKFFEKFSLTKLCAALQRKDWKEVERQQNKLGLEQFFQGIGSRKPVAIVQPILKSSK